MIVNIIDIYTGYQVNPLDDDDYYINVNVSAHPIPGTE